MGILGEWGFKTLQSKGFSPVWTVLYLFRFQASLNTFLQSLHSKGISPNDVTLSVLWARPTKVTLDLTGGWIPPRTDDDIRESNSVKPPLLILLHTLLEEHVKRIRNNSSNMGSTVRRGRKGSSDASAQIRSFFGFWGITFSYVYTGGWEVFFW